MKIVKVLLGIVFFLPLVGLRIVGCFLSQRQETIGKSFVHTYNAMTGKKGKE